MRKNVFLKKRPPLATEMSLQITSMADIFIIILVFLLKSYSSGNLALNTSKGVELPSASLSDSPVEALKVEISENSILIENDPAAIIKNYTFYKADLQQDGSSKSLDLILSKERKRQLIIVKSNARVKIDSRIIVIADKKVPYSTIKTVLASAAVNGYTDFKLAVINN